MVFILVVLVAGLLGSNAQTPCCFPSQWESITGFLEGYHVAQGDTHGEVQGKDYVSYDYDNKRVVSNLSLVTDKDTKIRMVFIADFNTRKVYQITGDNCTSMNLAGEMVKNCIPDNATYSGTTFFGAGNNRLYFDTWQMDYMGIPIIFTVTKKDCIPISESLTALGPIAPGVGGFAVLSYTGLTAGIKDERVFDPPTNCRHVNVTSPDAGGGFIGSIIGRKKRSFLQPGF